MKINDYSETEKLLSKRFAGVKKDLKDPGYIDIEYREKETVRGFFGRPAMQLAGALLTAVLVAGLTFFGLKYLEMRGEMISGHQDTTGVKSPVEPANDCEIYVLDIQRAAETQGENLPYPIRSLLDDHDLRISVDDAEKYLSSSDGIIYVNFIKNGEENERAFTVMIKATKSEYPNNALRIKNGDTDELLFVSDTSEGQTLMVYDLKAGVYHGVDMTAVNGVLGGLSQPYYYLYHERKADGNMFLCVWGNDIEKLSNLNWYTVKKYYVIERDSATGQYRIGEETEPLETTAPDTDQVTEEGPVWDPDLYGELIYVIENGETVSNLSFANVRFLQTDQTMQGRRDTLIYYADDLTVTAAEGVSVRKITTCMISATARYKTVYHNTLDELNEAIRNGSQLEVEGIHVEIEAESDMFYKSYAFDVQYGERGAYPAFLSVSNGSERVYPQSYLVYTEEIDENGNVIEGCGDGAWGAEDVITINYKHGLSADYHNGNVFKVKYILYDGPQGDIILSKPKITGINNYLDNAAPGTYRLVVNIGIRTNIYQSNKEYEYAVDILRT